MRKTNDWPLNPDKEQHERQANPPRMWAKWKLKAVAAKLRHPEPARCSYCYRMSGPFTKESFFLVCNDCRTVIIEEAKLQGLLKE